MDKTESYLKRERGYGAGDVRIGEFLECGDDIYSLGFVAQISDELIKEHFDVLKGELLDEKAKKKREKARRKAEKAAERAIKE